jgi:hypothetical protein
MRFVGNFQDKSYLYNINEEKAQAVGLVPFKIMGAMYNGKRIE